MSKPNIANFVTPTGQHGNLFQPSTWIPMIIGAGLFLGTFAMGQRLIGAVHNKIPAIAAQPSAPFASNPAPQASTAAKRIWS